MKSSPEGLVAALTADLKPVRGLRPPMLRAVMALAVIPVLAAAAALLFAYPAAMGPRLVRPRFAAEFTATLLTGVAGVATGSGFTRIET